MDSEAKREYMRKYRQDHKDERTEYMRRWRAENPERVQQHDHDYYLRNREMIDKRTREWQVNHPEIVAAYARKYRYGITPEDYQNLLDECGGVCSICGATGKLHVDHNEATGEVRALLCPNCNKMIGLAKENIATLISAAMYLKCFQESEP